MDIEEHVRAGARRGYALASVVALMFLLTVILGMAASRLHYALSVTEAWRDRVTAGNAVESMTNFALKWLASETENGARPRAQAAVNSNGTVNSDELTDFDSLLIFASTDYDGCEVKVYDLDYAAGKIKKTDGVFYWFPPSFPGGYMIRASAEKKGMAPLTLESVYEVSADAVLRPVYSRELFRK